ncbi:MAG TPA: methyltransferase domain-containing protein [Ignavibacteria bacterium]|nr:methyltransferase domain-containing protein [Ignavibacteria bacterium]HQY52132.1 methyltransferase domain-containing protein [Ignavibacteria bacterium]
MNRINEKVITKHRSNNDGNVTCEDPEAIRKISNVESWNSNYRTGNIGWDIGEVSPPIKNYIDQIKNKNIKILIPGCGNAYEAEYLSKNAFKDITLLDISSVVTNELIKKFAKDKNINVICMNFFEQENKYDLILEQTFFCALNPDLREEYCKKMIRLLNTSGKLVGVLFDREFDKDGPPYGGSKKEYEELLKKYFDVKVLEKCYNSVQPRSGSEVFINLKNKN